MRKIILLVLLSISANLLSQQVKIISGDYNFLKGDKILGKPQNKYFVMEYGRIRMKLQEKF